LHPKSTSRPCTKCTADKIPEEVYFTNKNGGQGVAKDVMVFQEPEVGTDTEFPPLPKECLIPEFPANDGLKVLVLPGGAYWGENQWA